MNPFAEYLPSHFEDFYTVSVKNIYTEFKTSIKIGGECMKTRYDVMSAGQILQVKDRVCLYNLAWNKGEVS